MEANSKNHYNILAAVTIKGGRVSPVESVILEEYIDSCIFLLFVKILLEKGVLSKGDICIVDNCTAHTTGDNTGLHDELFNHHGVLMITLPPYHPDLNPTELVFQTLLQRLVSLHARYNAYIEQSFVDEIIAEMNIFTLCDALSSFQKCGYNY